MSPPGFTGLGLADLVTAMSAQTPVTDTLDSLLPSFCSTIVLFGSIVAVLVKVQSMRSLLASCATTWMTTCSPGLMGVVRWQKNCVWLGAGGLPPGKNVLISPVGQVNWLLPVMICSSSRS